MMTEMLCQVTAVAIKGRAVLIEGPPGCGKSTLALTLIDRGAILVGDDGVALEKRAGVLWAGPPLATEGRLEVRGVGLVTVPAAAAPVALVLKSHGDPPRFVEVAGETEIAGFPIPSLPFDLHADGAALRAEYALTLHGLPHGGSI